MKKILLTILLIIVTPQAQATVIFEDNFDSQLNWSPDGVVSCSMPGDPYCASNPPPTGWSYYRSTGSWFGSGYYNTDYITQYIPNPGQPVTYTTTPAGYGDTGKAFVLYTESNIGAAGDGWGNDGQLTKSFSDKNEIWARFRVRTQSGWQWQDGVSGTKVFRAGHYDAGAPQDIYTYFADGDVGPLFIWDFYYSTVWGVRLSNSYRCDPQATEYYCGGTPHVDGSLSDIDGSLFPGAKSVNDGDAYTSTPLQDNMYATGNWHLLYFHLKMNSAPGVADGIYEFWWDVPDTSATPTSSTSLATGAWKETYANGGGAFHRSNMEWQAAGAPGGLGWNFISLGGNNYNSSLPGNVEQWVAFDDFVLSDSAIPANYVIGVDTDTTAPTTTIDPSGGRSNTAYTVSISCSDNTGCASTQYCLGSNNCTPASSYTTALTVKPGNWLCSKGTDAAGNAESPHCAYFGWLTGCK